MMKRMIASLLIFSQVAFAGRLQDADFKTEAELVAAGSSAAQLLNDSKVYVTANGLNKKLSTAITDGDIGGGGVSTDNKLTNPGFEKGTTGWTESGGTFASTSTASEVFEGTKAVTWDSSAASQTLTGTAITVGGFAGQNAELTCNVRVPSGTATHTLGVWNGTTLSNAVTISNTSGNTNYVATTINFIAPSSGTVTARFTSVASNEPSISIDDCYLGKARNIGTVQQARIIGTIKITGCTGAWTTTSTSFASFGAQTNCSYTTTGDALAPTGAQANLPAIRFSSLPTGEYRLEYEGRVGESSGGVTSWFRFNDGTSSSKEESAIGSAAAGQIAASTGVNHSITYSSPQSNVTLQIQGKTNGGTATIFGTTASPGVIKVWYFPSSSQQAVTSAQADYDWTSYGTTSDFTGFGTVSAIELQHKRQGPDLLIKGKFTSGISTPTEARIALPSGLTSASTSKIPSLQVAGSGFINGSASTVFGWSTLIEPNVSYITVGIQTSTSNGLTKANGNNFISNGQIFSFNARIPIQGWNENQRAPTLVGSITSNSSGAERIERAVISSTCTITSQSGSWISSISGTATNSGCTLTLNSGFSAAPTVILTSDQSNHCVSLNNVTPTTSTISIIQRDCADNAAGTSGPIHIHAIGPR